jgi:cytochrome c551/c552
MKTSGIILVIFLCLFFVSALSADEQGKEIFKSNGCIFCHKMGRSTGTIPSLPDLAEAYKGKKEQLIRYFKGEAHPIIEPERAGTMKRQIEKTKAMSDSDRAALADFMLGH